jgi:hypothetical protein
VNFTREPIIETIISPKEGYKLCIRNSKAANSEEFFVDAVEVVSFGQAFFFRGLERPKPFLVPVTDYEIFEVKETRVVLKNIAHERNIKIGGGRDAPVRAAKEPAYDRQEEVRSEAGVESPEETPAEVTVESKNERKRDRRRHRRRRMAEERREWIEKERQQETSEASSQEGPKEEGGGASDETKVSSSMFSNLFPPPPTLISEKLSRYKDKETSDGSLFSESLKEDLPKEDAFFHEEKEEGFSFPSTLSSPPQGENSPDEKNFFS